MLHYRSCFRDTGFFSKEKIKIKDIEVAPIDLISKLHFSNWKYQAEEEDFTIMRVTIKGEDSAGKVKHVYSLYDRYDKETSVMSMARTTGYTCTAAARLILAEKLQRKGIIPPEFIGESEKGFDFS